MPMKFTAAQIKKFKNDISTYEMLIEECREESKRGSSDITSLIKRIHNYYGVIRYLKSLIGMY